MEKLDVTAHNVINLKIIYKENMYLFSLPNSTSIDHAKEACNIFLSALNNFQQDKEKEKEASLEYEVFYEEEK